MPLRKKDPRGRDGDRDPFTELKDLGQHVLWQLHRIAHALEKDDREMVGATHEFKTCPRCETLVAADEDVCPACKLDVSDV